MVCLDCSRGRLVGFGQFYLAIYRRRTERNRIIVELPLIFIISIISLGSIAFAMAATRRRQRALGWQKMRGALPFALKARGPAPAVAGRFLGRAFFSSAAMAQ